MFFEVAFLERALPWHEIGLVGLLSNLHEIVLAFPIIFLVLGVLYCFFGRRVFDIINFFIGGFVSVGFAVGLSGLSGIGMILISIVSFLVGGLIGFLFPYLFVGIVGFSIGLGLLVSFSPLFGLLAGILVAVVAVLLFRFFLPILTALVGGSLVAYALFDWTGSEPISLVVGIVLIVTGTIYQYVFLKPHERESKEKGKPVYTSS